MKLVLFALLAILSIPCFGQYSDMYNDIHWQKDKRPKNLKRIVQYEDTTILNIIEYDRDGK